MAPELPGWAGPGAGGKSKVITGPEKKNGTTRKQVIDKQLGWHTKGKLGMNLFFLLLLCSAFFLGGGALRSFSRFIRFFGVGVVKQIENIRN